MSECGCISVGACGGDFNGISKTLVSRGFAKCGECGRTIKEFETYDRNWYFEISDDDGYAGKNSGSSSTCCDCESIALSFFCDGSPAGQIWDYLRDHITEMKGEIKSECLDKLTPVARQKVINMMSDVIDKLNEND